jgi:hypothetical protein
MKRSAMKVGRLPISAFYWSYVDALALNATLGLRDPNSSAELAIKLYAIYLNGVIGIETIGDI